MLVKDKERALETKRDGVTSSHLLGNLSSIVPLIGSILRSCYNIPKAIFYLLKGDYSWALDQQGANNMHAEAGWVETRVQVLGFRV